MAHRTVKTPYHALIERLNRFPQGAPPSETLHAILKMLFSEREAELVALLPIRPFTAAQAADRWRVDLPEARRVLDGLASRAILVDAPAESGETVYTLPPPMAGFLEFSMMRLRGDVDQHLLAQLFHQYLNVEEDFVRALFAATGTPLGRVFVQERALLPTPAVQIMDYERASEVIRTATHRGVGLCYCRHKMQHMEQACGAPLDICMTFGGAADSLIRHGYARPVDAAEGLDLLQQAQDHGLVQCGENVQGGVAFICNCCGCCCEALVAARRFALLEPLATTNFIAHIDEPLCNGCGKCVTACPVEAMTLVSANDPRKPRRRKVRLNEELCLGCGVCVRTCPTDGLRLDPRTERIITPVNSVHRVLLMAIERGNLPQLIWDNHALASHRAMAAILGGILRLPPAKQLLASRQLKSRYLARVLESAGAG